jgi:hypothetical protein
MIPPRPKSRLGDRVALNVIVETNISLIDATTVLRRPVVIDEAVTLDVVTAPEGAFSVEKLPTLAVIVEAVILLKLTLPGSEKLDTVRVDAVIALAVRLDTPRLEMDPVPAFIVLTLIVLTLSGSGTLTEPLETLMVEKLPTLALTTSVVKLPV